MDLTQNISDIIHIVIASMDNSKQAVHNRLEEWTKVIYTKHIFDILPKDGDGEWYRLDTKQSTLSIFHFVNGNKKMDTIDIQPWMVSQIRNAYLHGTE